MSNWQAIANFETLRKRAELISKIRTFFHERNVLEVETPILAKSTIPDPHIISLKTSVFGKNYFLQTSPEFHMKRLLAAGSGCIYQVSKAFRDDELGQHHNPEFTMLEWYRIGLTAKELMNEIDVLLKILLNTLTPIYLSYKEAFIKFLNINPLEASISELIKKVKEQNISVQDLDAFQKDDWLNLLMSYCIEPKLNEKNQPYFIYDFPISQAALAKQSDSDPRVAERFEVYINGLELANGFHELTDASEQRYRFERYLTARKESNLEHIPMPENFLAALQHGLPACSGVALGIDRLAMLYCETNTISEVLTFTVENA